MANGDSPLATYVFWVKNYTHMAGKVNKRITIHHQAGQNSPEQLAQMFNGSRQASAQYGIANDGTISQMCRESDRAWTSGGSSSKYTPYPGMGGDNDAQAITIEVANETFAPNWTISQAAYKSLIALCADICKRNNIVPSYTGDLRGSLTLHKWFAATACPGPTLEKLMPQIAEDIKIAMGNQPTPTPQPVVSNEQAIWNYLQSKTGNAYATAGIMGNLYAESGLKPNNLQNTYEKKLGMTDDQYTQAVDNGSYKNFVHDSAGYGLAQWTYWSRKQGLLDRKGTRSISDINLQLDWLIEEMTASKLLDKLKASKSVKEASDLVLTQYERPADQSDAMKNKRAQYGQNYYNKYTGKTYFRVQVGAYKNPENAKKMVAQLKSEGFDAIIKQYGDIFRVQVGAYSKRENAENMLVKVKAAGHKDAFIAES